MASTVYQKEFYLHVSSEWHLHDNLKGWCLAEPRKSNTGLSPIPSGLYKSQVSAQTLETTEFRGRQQNECHVCLFFFTLPFVDMLQFFITFFMLSNKVV